MSSPEAEKSNNQNRNSIHSGHRRRMREKYLENGAKAFLSHEMLEMILYTAIPRGDTNPIAHRLLDRFGSFSGVLNASYEELLSVPGIGESSAFLIKLIPAAASVYIEDSLSSKTELNSVNDIAMYLRSKYFGVRTELPSALLLDAKMHILRWVEIGHGGSFNSEIVSKKLVSEVVMSNAPYAVLCHNHPSGVALPSKNDIETTKTLVNLMRTIDCRVIDHIILTDDDFVSMRNSSAYSYIFDYSS